MNIYTSEGWLDTKHIDEVADRNNINFIVIVGKRQVGKTYGVLKLMLDDDRRFILMRRVRPELDMLCKDVNSPFEKIPCDGLVKMRKESEYTAAIEKIVESFNDDDEAHEEKIRIGTGMTLTGAGNIRGFNGDIFSDLILDEFIPEEQVYKVRNEGDAFLNAYVTISGNRELEGRKPLKVWLLSNSNNLNSRILEALHITDVVEKMSLRGEESRILKNRGIMVLLPESKAVTEKRKKTALYKAIGGDSKFSKMAFENEFAYNDYTDVMIKPLQEYNPIITIGRITIHLHKNEKTLYVTDKVKYKPRHQFTDSDTHINTFNRKFPEVKAAYLRGKVYFQDMRIKNYFLDIIDN